MKTSLLIIKLAGFTTVMAALQIVVSGLSGYKDTPATVQLIDRYLTDGTTVLFFGDSTLYRGSTENTVDLLQTEMPSEKIGGLYHDAYSPVLFEHFVRYLTKRESTIDTIIIPINLRAFSPERMFRPEYQFAREKLYLRHGAGRYRAFIRPMSIWKALDLNPVTEEEFDNVVVYDGDTRLGTMREIQTGQRQGVTDDLIRATYFYPLESSHPQLQALSAIQKFCDENGIRLLAYITPTDLDTGESLIPGEFRDRVSANITQIKSTLRDAEIAVLDLANDMNPVYFTERDYPEAYVLEDGKRFIAGRLAEELRLSTP